MLNRVIKDIYYLRKVHAILPDAVLGDTLKNKLLRLSLQPTLQHIKHTQQQDNSFVATSSNGSGGDGGVAQSLATSSFSSSSSVSTTAGRKSRPGLHSSPNARSAADSPYAINPRALCYLLDSLAYFHLGTSAVAREAVQLVQLTAPTMTTSQVCTTLAACCALGSQQDITATALPLLSTALTHYTVATSEEPLLLFSQGASVVMLMEALQKAGVREREVWHVLAEHCLRYLESFDGRQLCAVVSALCAEGVDDYPDFFVAAERHITSQPPNYLAPHLLQQLVQCYKELHQPVVSLLAMINSTPLHEEDLDRSISAAATVAALSASQNGAHATHSGLSGRGSTLVLSDAKNPISSASVENSLAVFESAATSALAESDTQGVLELLRKCERRRIMTASVMDKALRRLLLLCYPDLSPDHTAAAKTAAVPAAEGAGDTSAEKRALLPVELHRLSQSLLLALEFNDAALFVAPAASTAPSPPRPPSQASTPAKTTRANELAQLRDSADANADQPALPVISVLLNAIGQELDHWYHPRLLQTVPYAVRLLPAADHPRDFFTALVDHLRRSNDLSTHEGPRQLRCLVEALLALRQYGGEATLIEYMPAMTVAVLNAPRSSQLELTAIMAHLPCAAKELVPGVYRQWGTQKRWLRTITEEEVTNALHIMSRTGQRDSQLLHAVVAFVQAQRNELPPQRVVEYLHQLARLGVRDLELFTHTAEHLMRRAVESSPLPTTRHGHRHNDGRGGGGSGRTWSTSASATTGAAGGGSGESAPSLRGAKHLQWQITTVHDLALLLFTFTFVLRDSIRVTQQIIARLKMCSSAATPRDTSLALYSFVKLRVARNDEVTGQLCERAVATLPEFKPSELASMWSSLRCLCHFHPRLYQRTLELLDTSMPLSAEAVGQDHAAKTPLRFSDGDCLSLASALLLTETAPLNLNHPLVQRHGGAQAEGVEQHKGDTSLVPPRELPQVPAAMSVSVVKAPLPSEFERHFLHVCRRLLPSATGQRLYLILCSLSRCNTIPTLSLDAWETILKLVETHAESMATGRLDEAPGMAQFEVLGALRVLHPHVADADALAAADAVRLDSNNWITSYCPPALWGVLRPRWRDLSRSAAAQTHSGLQAAVAEIRVGAAEVTSGAQPKTKGAATRKTQPRRGRKG